MTENEESWHLDKRVPIAIMLALFLQTVGFIYFATSWKVGIEGRVGNLEANQQGALPRVQANTDLNYAQERRLAILETKLEDLGTAIGRIENGVSILTRMASTKSP